MITCINLLYGYFYLAMSKHRVGVRILHVWVSILMMRSKIDSSPMILVISGISYEKTQWFQKFNVCCNKFSYWTIKYFWLPSLKKCLLSISLVCLIQAFHVITVVSVRADHLMISSPLKSSNQPSWFVTRIKSVLRAMIKKENDVCVMRKFFMRFRYLISWWWWKKRAMKTCVSCARTIVVRIRSCCTRCEWCLRSWHLSVRPIHCCDSSIRLDENPNSDPIKCS